MIKVIAFSKMRPMQLDAYLGSIIYNADINEDKIHVITADPYSIYDNVEQDYPNVAFWPQENLLGFENTLRHVVEEQFDDNDHILFGCDDVVYTRSVDLNEIEYFLNYSLDNNFIGYSLRLGSNIENAPVNMSNDLKNMVWNWRAGRSHWGYPFELMASIYPVSLVKEILYSNAGHIKTPNFLEAIGVEYVYRNRTDKWKMACYNGPSCAVAQDVNRVQNDFPNKFTGTDEHDAQALVDRYLKGNRLSFRALMTIMPPDVFVGNKYWAEYNLGNN